MRGFWEDSSGTAAASVESARSAGRDFAERVRVLARFLSPADRALVEQVYGQGQSAAALARAMRLPVHRVRRRLCRVLRRLRKRRFRLAAALGRLLPDDLREPVVRVVLRGQGLRRAAAAMHIPVHTLRHRLAVAIATLEGLERGLSLARENIEHVDEMMATEVR